MNQKFEMTGNLSEYATMPLCASTVTQEVTGDYTLPDYQPEVRRVLYVGAQILPPAKYRSGTRVELNGGLDYTLVYVGMDGELYSAPLSTEYSMALALEDVGTFDLGEGVELLCDLDCDTVSARLTAPRRLSIKCRLRAKMAAYGKRHLEEEVSGLSDPLHLERLEREVIGLGVTSNLSDVIVAEETISLPNESVRVVSADAVVLPSESRVEGGRITMGGRVEGRLLCAKEEANGVQYEAMPFQLPIEGAIEYEASDATGCQARVGGRISELNVNATEEGITVRANVVLDAQILWKEEIRYTEDLYSTDQMTKCGYAEHTVPVLRTCLMSNFSQSERLAVDTLNMPEGSVPVAVFGRAMAEELNWENGKGVLSGRSHYTVICRKEDDIFSTELLLPFRFACDCPEMAEDFFCRISISSPTAKLDGDALMLDAELFLCATLLGHQDFCRVQSADFGDGLPAKEDALIVCYPAPGDTSWTVAKKYAVSPEKVLGNPEIDRYVMIQ